MANGAEIRLSKEDLNCLVGLVKYAIRHLEIPDPTTQSLLCHLEQAYNRADNSDKVCRHCRYYDMVYGRCWLEGWRTFPQATCSWFEAKGIEVMSNGDLAKRKREVLAQKERFLASLPEDKRAEMERLEEILIPEFMKRRRRKI